MVRPNKIIAPSLSFVIAVYTKFKKYLSINAAHSKSIGTFLITLFPVVGVKAKLFHPQSTSNYHTSGLEYSIFFSFMYNVYISKLLNSAPVIYFWFLKIKIMFILFWGTCWYLRQYKKVRKERTEHLAPDN